MYAVLVSKVQKGIMKKMNIDTVRANLREMGWTNTKGNMAQLAHSRSLNLVYDTEEEAEEKDEEREPLCLQAGVCLRSLRLRGVCHLKDVVFTDAPVCITDIAKYTTLGEGAGHRPGGDADGSSSWMGRDRLQSRGTGTSQVRLR
eukprot:1960746-Prymnesium_polylepis.1